MQLVTPVQEHFEEMASWVKNQAQLHEWAGPNARFPCTAETLMDDFSLSQLPSYSLVDGHNVFLAFGQYYQRLDHCHFGRLIVAPIYRGKNHQGKRIIEHLIDRLSDEGCRKLNTSVGSLFVLEGNQAAIKAYQNIGFQFAAYPGGAPFESCLYMTKSFKWQQ